LAPVGASVVGDSELGVPVVGEAVVTVGVPVVGDALVGLPDGTTGACVVGVDVGLHAQPDGGHSTRHCE